ncbi:DUF4265 domain-containing protein [Streptomyces sp. NPDC047009]|uniref:DUF4265 domain-containing protein n=1 Tax=unclassified Streptomyces TaxID=2593676 RepID=UPI0034086D0F
MQLDKIPWFVRGIACGDIVATEPDEEGVRWAGGVARRSENCTIRPIVFRDGGSGAARQSVINAFQVLGVDGEGRERFGTTSEVASHLSPRSVSWLPFGCMVRFLLLSAVARPVRR